MTSSTDAARPNGTVFADMVHRATSHPDAVAIVDDSGPTTYGDLVDGSQRLAHALLGDSGDLGERRVGYLVTPSALWTIAHWGITIAGGIAVPLLGRLPDAEIGYILDDSGADFLIADAGNAARVAALAQARGLGFGTVEELMSSELPDDFSPPAFEPNRGCLMMYTSGSTGKPKGVVWTHGSLLNQLIVLHDAWGWSSEDVALLVLPLHHVHGVVNVLSTALWAGATCRIPSATDADRIWEEFVESDISVFMAVPTIYHRLIASWDTASPPEQEQRSRAAQQMRLMVSGSAALPIAVLDRWREITSHTLLERYGMTELGMVLSNPLEGERIPGAVGRPLPTVETRVVDDEGAVVVPPASGHLQVRGPSVFREYWDRPEQTSDAFVDGWFMTGDVVSVDDGGTYSILGRDSVDIIKTGGEKVSALEIEDTLREHPAIDDCAVVGLPDPEWGERVAAAIVPVTGESIALDELRDWARERLAPFKLPTVVITVDALPRNAMGKVVKPDVIELTERER